MQDSGLYIAGLEYVKKKLSKYSNVRFYKGIFPQIAFPVEKTEFSFVHLDVEIYSSTKDCIEFFYPRMVTGGIIISHGYHAEGVRKAFDDFLENKSEKIIELPMSQCIIVKN
jgi:O-methyltransferase